MSPAMMKEGCRSYKEWGRSMKQSVKWTPTEHQMSWWKSLAMPMKERKAHHYSRSKRQARPTSLRKEYRALTDAVSECDSGKENQITAMQFSYALLFAKVLFIVQFWKKFQNKFSEFQPKKKRTEENKQNC